MATERSQDPPEEHREARRAVTYVRVSSREQVDGYSISAQHEACRRLIEDEGWTLAGAFTDEGESARTQDRPQFQALLQTLKEDPTIDVLVVHKLDRLARNLEDHVAVRAQLRKHGVQLVSVSESLEESASGKLVEGIMASIAEFYSVNLAQEVRKGMTEKARRGGWPTLAPVGYKNIRLPNGGGRRRGEAVIVPDEEQAPLVKEAFELYATGEWTLTALYERMRKKGLRNRQRRHPISRSAFADMLHSRAYIGKVEWHGAEYDGTHEPLIEEDLFNQVQEVFRTHDRAGVRRRRNSHYLKGTLYCGTCGSRMSTLNAKGRYTYFYCLGRQSGRTQCQEPFVKAEELEEQVEELYRRVHLPEAVARSLQEELHAEIDRRQSNRLRSEKLLRQRLDRLESERTKVLAAYYDEAVTSDQLKAEQKRIDREVAELQDQLTQTEQGLTEANERVERALTLAEDLQRAYVTASPKVRRRYNQALLPKVYVEGGVVTHIEQLPDLTNNDKAHGTAG